MMLDPYAHIRIRQQERERTMANLALERAARKLPGRFDRLRRSAAPTPQPAPSPRRDGERVLDRRAKRAPTRSTGGRTGLSSAAWPAACPARSSSVARELATLLSTAGVGATRDGRRLVLVGGEAGVGKSRLVAEAVARCATTGGSSSKAGRSRSATTACRSVPIVEVLRALAREVDTGHGSPRPRARALPEPRPARPRARRRVVAAPIAARDQPAGLAPDPDLRGRPQPARPARRGSSGPARHRGPPLGRPIDP